MSDFLRFSTHVERDSAGGLRYTNLLFVITLSFLRIKYLSCLFVRIVCLLCSMRFFSLYGRPRVFSASFSSRSHYEAIKRHTKKRFILPFRVLKIVSGCIKASTQWKETFSLSKQLFLGFSNSFRLFVCSRLNTRSASVGKLFLSVRKSETQCLRLV